MNSLPTFHIQAGFAPQHRAKVADLFWSAFGGKLGRVMRPEPRALRFLTEVADPAHAISAVDLEGALVGVAGFKTSQGALVGGGFSELAMAYGSWGALWRAPLLALLERPVVPGALQMDGIFVESRARGLGIGTALLAAVREEALRRGDRSILLDVIDSNPRARALYERNGFVAESTASLGPLRHLFGFRQATTMRCSLEPS
ncbi:MAG: GNAT family N-acetyltransferase [Planctomycetes bacterium]|nr:GNAT family N-acetyltransferase [Planctomycetota bacterium]HPF15873.1 GNAT family N-acetyltransferase [Planctomycetota bacterium]HRV82418.1 GNAT family N-acetyltransferase [Planctomycetota bacterium]